MDIFLRFLFRVSRAMGRCQNVFTANQRAATPEFRTFGAMQKYSSQPRPLTVGCFNATDNATRCVLLLAAFVWIYDIVVDFI